MVAQNKTGAQKKPPFGQILSVSHSTSQFNLKQLHQNGPFHCSFHLFQPKYIPLHYEIPLAKR